MNDFRPSARRFVAAAAAAGLLLAPLAGLSAPASATDTDDAKPQSAEALLGAAKKNSAWLSKQLVNGAIPSPFDPSQSDWGLSIDTIIAMHASGDAKLATPIVRRLDNQKQAENYFTYKGFMGEDGADDRIAGATAKTLVSAEVSGRKPRAFGGYNMVQEVKKTVITPALMGPGKRFPWATDPNEVGRISDYGPNTTSNYGNSFGQILAVIGLAGAGANDAKVIDKLLWQQCSEGYFRIFYSYNSETDKLENCNRGKTSPGGNNSAPDRDTTGFAVSALIAAKQAGATGLDAKIAKAVSWLKGQQKANGGWGGGVGTGAPNTNSTGLITQALAGRPGTGSNVSKGASFISLAQATAARDSGNELKGEIGAIAYSRGDYITGKTDGLDDVRDSWIRASAQASLGLSQVSFATLVKGPQAVAQELATR